jgi:hypothetical protein
MGENNDNAEIMSSALWWVDDYVYFGAECVMLLLFTSI